MTKNAGMKKVLITGAGSYVGTNVMQYLMQDVANFEVDTVDTFGNNWKKADYSKYDVVYHVAGIAEVNGKKGMENLYYRVNTDLTIEIAKYAKRAGVKQFIFMSSMIVYQETRSLKDVVITKNTPLSPNGVYGDSKRKAEEGLRGLADNDFKICILRPPMIYGPKSKSNLVRLGKLATLIPVFPNWGNKRSMLYIDNLSEFVRNAILRELSGVFFPQNKEQSATVDIIKFFAKKYGHKIWITRIFNPLVFLGSFILQPINKMFASYYYEPTMSQYNFEYQNVSFEDSLSKIDLE